MNNKSVKLTGKMYGVDHLEWHENIKEAAESAYYAIEFNEFYPVIIEMPDGEIIWSMAEDKGRSKLSKLAEINDSL